MLEETPTLRCCDDQSIQPHLLGLLGLLTPSLAREWLFKTKASSLKSIGARVDGLVETGRVELGLKHGLAVVVALA